MLHLIFEGSDLLDYPFAFFNLVHLRGITGGYGTMGIIYGICLEHICKFKVLRRKGELITNMMGHLSRADACAKDFRSFVFHGGAISRLSAESS